MHEIFMQAVQQRRQLRAFGATQEDLLQLGELEHNLGKLGDVLRPLDKIIETAEDDVFGHVPGARQQHLAGLVLVLVKRLLELLEQSNGLGQQRHGLQLQKQHKQRGR